MRDGILKDVLRSISQGVLIADVDRKITDANDAFTAITGYSLREIIGGRCDFLQGPETSEETIAAIKAALAERKEFSGEILNYKKCGTPFWNDLSISPTFDEAGELTGYIGITRDLTAYKDLEGTLQDYAKTNEWIFDRAGAGMVIHAPDGKILAMNPAAKAILHISDDPTGEDTTSERWYFVREDGSRMPEAEFPFVVVMRMKTAVRDMILGSRVAETGATVWLRCDGYPEFDPQGKVDRVLITFSDISKIRSLQLKAERDRERFALASVASNTIVFDWQIKSGDFWASDTYSVMFGIAPPSKRTLDIIPDYVLEEDRQKYQNELLAAIGEHQGFLVRNFRYRRPTGDVGYARSEYLLHYNKSGDLHRIVGSKSDLTEDYQRTMQLRRSEERFQRLAKLSNDVVWEVDLETEELWLAPEWRERLGLSSDLKISSLNDWLDIIVPEDQPRIRKQWFEALHSTARRRYAEYRVRGSSGYVIIEDHSAIMRDDDQNAVKVVGYLRDVTALRSQEERDRQSERLEALGKLTGGVAHDFNNMLMVILGNAEMLGEDLQDPELHSMVELILTAASNGAELTSRLLSFSRKQPMLPQPIVLRDHLDKTRKLIRHGLTENIELEVELPKNPVSVEVDPSQLDNALINLAINARDAMPTGGKVSLSVTRKVVSRNDTVNSIGLEPGRYVVISVSDTGQGIADDDLSHVLEPFFTTKPVGEGSGLGLSMVYGFAKQSGGDLSIESEVGKGTKVSIILPELLAKSSPTVVGQDDRAPADLTTVLVVEDEEPVRESVIRRLEKFGLHAIGAENADHALELASEGIDFDVLLTDVVMPGTMDGFDLAEALRMSLKELKIIFTSGYPPGPVWAQKFRVGTDCFLQKPYTKDQLLKALMEVQAGNANAAKRREN
ncbi:hybrid sensor histidine kinase/response regulator [Qipengyuania gaetbuli]|nr:PAS domain-containing sensor histidine kinase [Qipengyuania gaetbuli]